ncbi:MAG: DoxX family protein [Hamadaea sp.]|nr:DoxX family protein [Hamadaea sp.]NUR52207.1 DoxX family protein [Hamadaea sp.]NUT02399.1 DoxX family protein [Hamadaea sp.]
MFAATIAVTAVLAALLAYAAIRKLSHEPSVVASYARVGVPEERLNLLAVILFAGAAGALAGLVWAPLGVAAAVGLVLYFALAVGAHVRFHDLAHIGTPIVLLLLAVVALVLRLLTA